MQSWECRGEEGWRGVQRAGEGRAGGPPLTADEAGGLQDLLFLLLLTPQVSKSVNDDPENQVQDNDDDHEEEQKVVDHTGSKQWFLGQRYPHEDLGLCPTTPVSHLSTSGPPSQPPVGQPPNPQ